MLYMNGGIGWTFTVRHEDSVLDIERLENDSQQNVRLKITGDSSFTVTPSESIVVVTPPGRIEIRRKNDRLLLYVSRQKIGVRIGWRMSGTFDIHRHRVRALQEVIEYIIERTGGRVYDLAVTFNGDGVLVMQGTCTSYYTKQLAQESAAQICKLIQNEIKVVKK